MMKWILVLATLAVASPAFAHTIWSRDECPTTCQQHQLQWRAVSTDAWSDVGSPTDVSNVCPTAPCDTPALVVDDQGVKWDGVSGSGEYQVKALRNGEESPYSPVYNVGEPPVAPMLLSGLAMLAWLKRRRDD